MSKKQKSEGLPILPPLGLAEEVLAVSPQGTIDLASPERLYQFTDALAAEQTVEPQAAQKLETWVTFLLDHEVFALPVSHVIEILRVSAITRVPHAPHTVRGVTNLRGRVLPVVDLRVRLGMAELPVSGDSRILVVTSRGRLLGLLVDGVQQVLRLNRYAVEPPPPDVVTTQSDYIIGVYHLDAALVILLDVDRVLVMSAVSEQSVVA